MNSRVIWFLKSYSLLGLAILGAETLTYILNLNASFDNTQGLVYVYFNLYGERLGEFVMALASLPSIPIIALKIADIW
jgi:hypothetical protein